MSDFAIITLEEVANWNGSEPTDTSDVPVMAQCVQSALAYWERRLNRTLAGDGSGTPKGKVVTKFFSPKWPQQALDLPDVIVAPSPVTAIDPLFEIRAQPGGAWSPLDSLTALEFVNIDDACEGVFTRVRRLGSSASWPCGQDTVRGTYRAGYTFDDVPEDIRVLMLWKAHEMYRGRLEIREGSGGGGRDDKESRRASGEPDEITVLADLWTAPSVDSPFSTMGLG